MTLFANIIGVFAVALFVLSYQQKKRKNIIICNAVSRALYVIQYILLSAFSGAVLDILGIFASIISQKKNSPVIKRFLPFIIITVNAIIIAVGLLLYKTPLDLLPIFGVALHTGAFWLTNEKFIRIVSFLGSPFWLVYNLLSSAFGSAVGDILTMCSIGLAILRYDILKKNEP